jgi:phosphonate transport system ATP-binding protein
LLQLVDVTRRFGDKLAVGRASVDIGKGEMVGIIGRSGAGKSTLLRLVNRLIDPSEGRIVFDGIGVTALRGRELRAWWARTAMIFQQFNLVNRLDVLTNVMCRRLYEIPAPRVLLKWFTATERALAGWSAGSAGDGRRRAESRHCPAASSSAWQSLAP